MKWFHGVLNHLLEKINKFGCIECLGGSSRSWSTHNAENIESVHSQEDRPHSHRSVKQIAREAQISCSSVHNTIKIDFQIGLNFML